MMGGPLPRKQKIGMRKTKGTHGSITKAGKVRKQTLDSLGGKPLVRVERVPMHPASSLRRKYWKLILKEITKQLIEQWNKTRGKGPFYAEYSKFVAPKKLIASILSRNVRERMS